MTYKPSMLFTAAMIAATVPGYAQSKDVHAEMLKLEQAVNQAAATNPALATKLKARQQKLQNLLNGVSGLPAAPSMVANPNAYPQSSIVGPNYSISGPCGEFRSGTAGTTVSGSSSPALAIPDLGSVSDTITIGGLGTQVFDVDVTVAITHTWAADLDITLTSPTGTVVDVCSDNGGGNDDVFNGTLFDDESLNDPATYPYTNLVVVPDLRPDQSLNNTLRGENPNGGWTLTVTDDLGVDVGTLNSWSLAVTDGAIVNTPSNWSVSTYSTGPIAVPITDLTTSTVPLAITGASTSLDGVRAYVEITHTWNADLIIQLQSPAGTTLDLSNLRGAGNDNVFNGTLFDQQSLNPIATYGFLDNVVATNLQPEMDLFTLAGEDANGTWNLIVSDNANLDTGSINRFDLDVLECGGGTIYCTAKVNSLGCTPAIGATGTMSATANSGFVISSVNMRNNKVGLLFYTNGGQASIPFTGGTLCVGGQLRRVQGLNTGGTPPPTNDCSGVFSVDMNSFRAGLLGGNPNAFLSVPGTVVNSQFWGRDPGFASPNNTQLSDGIEYTVGP